MKSNFPDVSTGAVSDSAPVASSMPAPAATAALRHLVSQGRGMAICLGMAVNTVLCIIPMAAVAPVKLLSGRGRLRDLCDRILNGIALHWMGVNNWLLDFMTKTRWAVSGGEGLSPDRWYLLVANHQSWVDILVLQKVFHRRVPMLKFFIKRELLWMPLLGFAWWILDFPFMKRSAGGQRGAGGDLDTAMKACEKFRRLPVTVMNFLEGTRCTPEKQARQNSPYRHLLRPKCGGAAIVFQGMRSSLSALLDVTIYYPQGAPTFWRLVCGGVDAVHVDIRTLAVDDGLAGDYQRDPVFRSRIQEYFNSLWEEKDRRIARMAAGAACKRDV